MSARKPVTLIDGQLKEMPAGDYPAGRGITLLAALSPTAAAAVDALTVFSSAYDNYLVLGSGILPAANDYLLVRCANAGTVDTGTNYSRHAGPSPGAAFTNTSMQVSDAGETVLAAGRGLNFRLDFQNANATTGLKGILVQEIHQRSATPQTYGQTLWGGYSAANAVSGLRFFWNGGGNFAATGQIRIYGYNNT